jgi:hypothetical protein
MARATKFRGTVQVDGLAVNGKSTARGVSSVRGSATIATGLATVESVVASLESIGVGAGDPFVVTARPSGTAGSVDVAVKQDDGSAATVAVNVHWSVSGVA